LSLSIAFWTAFSLYFAMARSYLAACVRPGIIRHVGRAS
jgi:hypothetical protein